MKLLTVNDFQREVITKIEEYGRPPTMAAHMLKLGEETGELAEAVANFGYYAHSSSPMRIQALTGIRDECIDVIFVVMSLLVVANGSLLHDGEAKLKELTKRMGCGKFDGRFGVMKEVNHALANIALEEIPDEQ